MLFAELVASSFVVPFGKTGEFRSLDLCCAEVVFAKFCELWEAVGVVDNSRGSAESGGAKNGGVWVFVWLRYYEL